jgi:heme-degrading monooxygenase HmoA
VYLIVWRYVVDSERDAGFRAAYGPNGDWTRLFSTTPGYESTTLVALDTPGEYLTVDRWSTEDHFRQFLAEKRGEYAALDEELARLTVSEELIGRGTAS